MPLQLDEDTGLYFYGSRYYDPQLARFTQADSVVPSANTSQALNRYSYVKNNPLKFTDPTGHGWFSKIFKKIGNFIKQHIGTIITIALYASGWGIAFASIIGSAVSTVVNGGTFATFAVGVGVGIAAGVVAGAAGGLLAGGAKAWGAFVAGGLGGAALGAAMTGAAAGAISSVVYGRNIEKGLAYGAIGGLTGLAAAAVTSAAISFGKSVTEELVIQACELGALIEPIFA